MKFKSKYVAIAVDIDRPFCFLFYHQVFFLDYGNISQVLVSTLKEMSERHMELPFQVSFSLVSSNLYGTLKIYMCILNRGLANVVFICQSVGECFYHKYQLLSGQTFLLSCMFSPENSFCVLCNCCSTFNIIPKIVPNFAGILLLFQRENSPRGTCLNSYPCSWINRSLVQIHFQVAEHQQTQTPLNFANWMSHR